MGGFSHRPFSQSASLAICPSHACYKIPLYRKEMKKHAYNVSEVCRIIFIYSSYLNGLIMNIDRTLEENLTL